MNSKKVITSTLLFVILLSGFAQLDFYPSSKKNLEIGPNNDLWIYSGGKLFYSEDTARTIKYTGLKMSIYDINVISESIVMLSGSDGLFRSTDGGQTYVDLEKTGAFPPLANPTANTLSYNKDGVMVIQGSNSKLFWSVDFGASWKEGGSVDDYFNTFDVVSIDSIWAYNGESRLLLKDTLSESVLTKFSYEGEDLLVSPNGSTLILRYNASWNISTDRGDSWTRIFSELSDGTVQKVVFGLGGGLCFVTNEKKMHVTGNNGEDWSITDIEIDEVYDILHLGDSKWILTGENGRMVTYENGEVIHRRGGIPGDTFFRDITYTSKGEMYIMKHPFLYKTNDLYNWTASEVDFPMENGELFVRDDNSVFYVTCGEAYRANDYNSTWSEIVTGYDRPYTCSWWISEELLLLTGSLHTVFSDNDGLSWSENDNRCDFCFTDDVSDVCFLDENYGFAVGGDALLMKTYNHGQTWEDVGHYEMGHFAAVDFLDKQTGFVCGPNKIHKTTDGGETWTLVYEDNELYALDIKFLNEDIGFAAGYGFYLQTLDGGLSWERVEISYRFDFPIEKIHIDKNNRIIFTWQRSSFIVLKDFETTSVPAGINEVKEDRTEIEVFPNPNSGSFSVKVKDSDVEISIYNSIGELVGVSKDKNVDGLDPGFYLLSVKAGKRLYSGEIIVE